jgi:hypothetical protein
MSGDCQAQATFPGEQPAIHLQPTALAIYESVDRGGDLELLQRRLWDAWRWAEISEDEASYLSSMIEGRRPARQTVGVPVAPVRRFTPRRPQRSPDRKASRERRRRLGGSSALPDDLRVHYTEGQRSVLCIIAGEIKRHGICDLAIDKIAALAGVCRSTVQATVNLARSLCHLKITHRPQRGRKSLTNLIEIVSPKWLAWVRRAPSAAR